MTNGSILLLHDGDCPYGYFRHTGIFVEDLYGGSSYDNCIASGVAQAGDCTVYQTPDKFQSYDECVALYVKNCGSTDLARVVDNAQDFVSDSIIYAATSYKDSYNEMSCSKLAYASYIEEGYDLDNFEP